MNKLEFCQAFIYLEGRPISFAGRPYLPAMYSVDHGNLIARTSRQVEKSTFIANTILYECCRNPHAKILVVTPRELQTRSFYYDRLLPPLLNSPVISRHLLGKGSRLQVNNTLFSNGAEVKLRFAFHDADSCRGLSATMLMVDEVQDIAPRVSPFSRRR